MKPISQFMTTSVVGAALCFMPHLSMAQDYPEKPIEVVVGYSAGGGTDVMARTIASHLEPYLGNDASVVVKNHPGAGGQIGFTKVATAKADGYTLGTMNLPAALALTYDRKADYDASSFTWLANFVADPNTLVVRADSNIHSVADLVNEAKAKNGKLTVGLSSLGGNDHFAAIGFEQAAGVELIQVPFKGAAMARTSLLGGHVAFGTMAFSQTVGFENELRVLAVLSEERLSQAANVPTAKELGYDVVMGSYRGLVAPADMPAPVVAKLKSALSELSKDSDFLAEMAKRGSPVVFKEGAAYTQLAADQNKAAKAIWTQTPWK